MSSEHNREQQRNKLLFWFVSARPRRMKINCCFVFSQNTDGDSNSEHHHHHSDSNSLPRRGSSSVQKKSQQHKSSQSRRRVIRREDIGLPFDFRHTTHLGPESDLNQINARQLSIVCTEL